MGMVTVNDKFATNPAQPDKDTSFAARIGAPEKDKSFSLRVRAPKKGVNIGAVQAKLVQLDGLVKARDPNNHKAIVWLIASIQNDLNAARKASSYDGDGEDHGVHGPEGDHHAHHEAAHQEHLSYTGREEAHRLEAIFHSDAPHKS